MYINNVHALKSKTRKNIVESPKLNKLRCFTYMNFKHFPTPKMGKCVLSSRTLPATRQVGRRCCGPLTAMLAFVPSVWYGPTKLSLSVAVTVSLKKCHARHNEVA